MYDFSDITRPTLLLNENIARANLRRMAQNARRNTVRFRPHFKTHQSVLIGGWFREEGVQHITASSVEMAAYFARHGWQEITLAFTANLRQRAELAELAAQVHLGVLVESAEAVQALDAALDGYAAAWVKIDSGAGRTGIAWQDFAAALAVAKAVQHSRHLRLAGLLTHAGHTYRAASTDTILQIFHESVERMNSVRDALAAEGLDELEISVGDTPGCTLAPAYGRLEEIRPGNFILYDSQMLRLGVCSFADVAAVAACPVVALHPHRGEAVIYGGAVHLSTDRLTDDAGRTIYGLVCLPDPARGWSEPIPGAYVSRLSQEHGIVHLPQQALAALHIGDLLCIVPAHACLTVAALGIYRTLAGAVISTMHCA